jgi:hypothetical protein
MTNVPVPASLGSPNRPFTCEDLQKKENRVNVELFGAHSIPEFWEPLCDLLNIPHSAWLTRDLVDDTNGRPDFILNVLGGTQGCIEVELGGRSDEPQLERYRKRHFQVICIVGTRGGLRELPSLEDVAVLARSVAKKLQDTNRPAMAVLDHLADAIDRALNGFKGHAFVQPIPAHLRDVPWLKIAAEPLLRLQRAGWVTNRTISNRSLSLQLGGVPCMKGKRIALVTQRDRAVILLPAPGEMERVFDGAFEEVTMAWNEMFNHVMPRWQIHLDGNQWIRMEIKDFERNAERFAGVFALLAKVILSTDLV